MRVLSVSQSPQSLDIHWADGSVGKFHHVWLRDNCPCPDCRHPKTLERILYSASIPKTIAPASVNVRDDGFVDIEWNNDGHPSRLSTDWLREHCYTSPRSEQELPQPVHWGAEFAEKRPVLDYQDVMKSDESLLQWIEALLTYGFAIAKGAPPEPDEMERFGKRVAYLREIIFGRARNVKSEPNPYNAAFTALEVKPHTDLPNYAMPPGVQLLFCLVHEADGGDTILVDGFNVARQLREQSPEAYSLLSRIEVPFRIASDKADVRTHASMLKVDERGTLRSIRFSNQCLQPLDIAADLVEPFYEAYRLLEELVDAPENRITFRLNAGDVLAMNNHRCLHSRLAFDPNSGRRHLQVASLEMDDVLSRLRVLRRSSGDRRAPL